MKREPAWRRYLRFWGPEPASDVDDEFQFHIETKTDALIAAGMSPTAARREALRQFGPLRDIRRECCAVSKGRQGRASRTEYFRAWARDVQYAGRVLLKSRSTTAIAVLILAVGVGANTAVFTFLDRLLWAPLPVEKPSQLLMVSTSWSDNSGKRQTDRYFSYEAYLYLRDHNQVFSGLAAESFAGPRERRLREKIDRPAWAHAVSGNYFEVLGVRAAMGRALAPSDDRPAASHVAVASHRYWTRRFGRASDALGRTVYLNDTPFTIIGVLPPGFYGTQKGQDGELYIPLASLADVPLNFQPLQDGASMQPIGRLRAGVAARAAESNLQALWGPFIQAAKADPKFTNGRYPESQGERIECRTATAGRPGAEGENRRSLILLGAIAVLLLLMACVNVACLLAARGMTRQHEMAVRLSLGAGKIRILRQWMLESALLALAGGVGGLIVALWANRLLLLAFRWKERPIDLDPDWRVLGFALALSLLTGLLFGLAPALQSLGSGRLAFNQERTVAPRFGAGRMLIVLEVALSLVMVAGAAVFIRSFQNLRAVPVGFSTKDVSVIRLGPRDSEGPVFPPPGKEALALAEALAGAPRIESAGVADLLTFGDGRIGYAVAAADAPQKRRGSNLLRVDSRYFETLRIPLLAGRNFTARDDDRSPAVVILGESTSRRLFAQQSPLGRQILLGRTQADVIGVVGDIKFTSVAEPAPDVVFQPVLQGLMNSANTASLTLQIRSRLAPEDVAALVRNRIREGRLQVAVQSATPLEDAIAASMSTERLRMRASSLFGALALLLITAGMYGLMAFSVARRTREIGIRMALGSRPAGIARIVLAESMALVAAGVTIGIPGAIVVMKAVSGMLFGLAPIDIPSLVAAGFVLILTGAAATLAPAWRAAHLDPVRALRVQ